LVAGKMVGGSGSWQKLAAVMAAVVGGGRTSWQKLSAAVVGGSALEYSVISNSYRDETVYLGSLLIL
jgi:hypothetical protein